MPTLVSKTSNSTSVGHHDFQEQGFSVLEIMVALLLASLIFFAIPSGDTAAKHRALNEAVDDMDRTVRFAANEAILRNTVVRIRIFMDKNPVEYTVEHGPPGNLPLPDMPERTSLSLDEEKALQEKTASFDRQFTKVEEFESIKKELDPDVVILGVSTDNQEGLQTREVANIYFYPTGEKDAALIFFSTNEEIAWLEVPAFLPETYKNFEALPKESVARLEDVLQTRMDELYKEWISK